MRWLGPGAIAVVFVALAYASWGRWPDVRVDFGNQLYIPWQLTLGKTLYGDIAYKEGPLSMYVLALLFRVFGVSLRTLVWVNLALLAGLCWLVYGMFARACDRVTATVVVLVFLAVFAFSQYTFVANYNYICPYTHEQTHGLMLTVVMLVALERGLRGQAWRWCALAGLCLGLVALTKVELLVPASGAALFGLALLLGTQPLGRRAATTAILAFIGAVLAPVTLGIGLLVLAGLPPALAVRGAGGNLFLLDASVLGEVFYARAMGLDDPAGNLLWMIEVFLGVVAVAALAATASWAIAPRGRWWSLACVAVGLAACVGFASWSTPQVWRNVGRALPLTSAAACATLVWRCVRVRRDPQALQKLVPLALWSVYALLLLIKVVLNVRLAHYGFVLAMPATLLLVACLVWGVPAALGAARADGRLARALLMAAIVAGVLHYQQWSRGIYARKNLPVGGLGDTFLAGDPDYEPRAHFMVAAAERLRVRMPAGATLLVLPEGTMLNYWLRRSNPTRHTLFTPTAITFFGGEERVLGDLKAAPPDFIALVHANLDTFGVGHFGSDPHYGVRIMEWVRANYERLEVIGAEPFRDQRFGIVLLERRS